MARANREATTVDMGAGIETAAGRLFTGPGEMRARCRGLDWAATPLGHVDGWSPALQTVVRLVLDAPGAMCLYIGPAFIALYSDAYRSVLGAKHPAALGQPAAEVWSEIWTTIGPQYEEVSAGGLGLDLRDVPFQLGRLDGGAAEEGWFHYALSAVRDAHAAADAHGTVGRAAAVLAVVTETTARVRAERALEVERARLAEVFRAAPAFLAILRGPTHEFSLVNDAYYQLVGHRELLGKPVFDALPDIRGQGFEELLDGVLTTGEPFVGRELPLLVARTPGAPLEERFVDLVYLPLVEGQGSRAGVIAHGTDVTDHVRARRDVERLLAEAQAAREAADDARKDAERASLLLQDQAVEMEAQAEQLQEVAAHLEARSEEADMARRAADAERARATGILEATSDAYFALDSGYRFIAVNRAMETATGLTRQSLLGRSFWEMFPAAVGTEFERHYRAAATEGLTAQFEHDYSDGRLDLVVSVDAYPAEAGGVVVFWRDVTVRVRGTAERERLLAAERAARAEAEEANRAKSQFLAVMSHELRTPLNAIGGYAQLVELGVHGPVTEAQLVALGRIQSSQRHLLGLIAGVLDYSRAEAGGMTYRLTDVAMGEAVAEAEALVAPQIRDKGLELHWSGAPPGLAARADREKLQQILVNLLGNALKFTHARAGTAGRITVACAASSTGDASAGGDSVSISVRDTGEGIPSELLAQIFEPFVQVDQRFTRPHEGVGLGLAISRDLARGMGGEITVESTLGEGSTFTLTLPRA